MKLHVLIPAMAAALLALSGCIKEREMAGEQVPQMTITVSVPDDAATKVAFSVPGSEIGLHLAWQDGDQIRVICGSNSAVYEIQPGFTDHTATFKGPVVAGDKFDIICPGTLESVTEAEAEAGSPYHTQNGNGSTDHLVFTAKLSGVYKDDLSNIGFTNSWVEAHPGTTLNMGGIVKLVLTLPDELTAPKRVVMSGLGDDIAVNITGVDLTSEHVLTAYAQSAWEDIPILSGTNFTVSVTNEDESVYAVTKTIPADATLKAATQNIIKVVDGFEELLFAGGDGTQANPYLLANAKHLDNMHVDGVFKHGEKVYFRLIKDIDMQAYLASHAWIPLNKDNPYDYQIDFDGDGHIIDHFSIDSDPVDHPNNQTGFFAVLYGDAHDVTFTNATVTNSYGKPTAIFCAFCGYGGRAAHVYNVHVNGNINYSYNTDTGLGTADQNGPVGGLAGRIQNCVIESCSAFDMNIRSPKSYSGGLFGYDVSTGATVMNCWTSGIIGGDSAHGGNLNGQRTGGICGGIISMHTAIINCYSTMSVLNTYAMGGIAGHCNLDKGATTDTEDSKHPTQTKAYNTIEGCISWNDQITSHATDPGGDHYSSGAIAGFISTHDYLINCLRKSDLNFKDYNSWQPYDQENASPSNPLVVDPKPSSEEGKNYHYPYHGKAFSGTLSAAAKSLGWDEEVWNLDGPVPSLTGAIQTKPVSSGASEVPAGAAGAGPKYPTSEMDGWTVTPIRDGITYYHFDNKDYYSSYSTNEWKGNHEDVFIIDVDLNNPKYKVKLVYTSPTKTCSQIFSATEAIAAINCGYEAGSIAIKVNTQCKWDKEDNTKLESIVDYPLGLGISSMPNNTISDTGVPNWKSQGTVYFDGVRGVKMAFDGYDPAKAPGGSGNPPVKTVQEERLFYQFNTDDEIAFVSSAPMLIQNYNQVGKDFKTWYPRVTGESSEAPNTHQTSKHPRTAVALNADNHLLLIVLDGRWKANIGGQGMSAYWLTQFLNEYFNPQYALNLDGGGSSTMCVEGQGDASTHVVNYPVDNSKHNHAGERARDTFIVVVPADSE